MGDIIDRCPICKGLPTIGTDAVSHKPMVACMNICCSNMQRFIDGNVGVAMVKWNNWCKEQEVTEIRLSDDLRKVTVNSYRKCRECKWLNMNQKIVIGCLCTNPNKKFKTNTAQWKYPSTRACKLFEERIGGK